MLEAVLAELHRHACLPRHTHTHTHTHTHNPTQPTRAPLSAPCAGALVAPGRADSDPPSRVTTRMKGAFNKPIRHPSSRPKPVTGRADALSDSNTLTVH